jgi:hypothetical protein
MSNETFVNKKWETVNRTRCLVYTRVMGYLSPNYRYNVGKKSEFYSRKYFSKEKAVNHIFWKEDESIAGALEKTMNIVMSNNKFVEQYT